MDILGDVEFRKEIKTSARCGYLFFGDEDYLKSYSLAFAEDQICPDEAFRVFNTVKIDAVGFEPSKLLDAMMPLPMMADRKLIIVSGLDFTSMRSSELENLCDVLAQLEDYDYNTVIINVSAENIDAGNVYKKPSSTIKALCEHLVPVHFERSTPARLAAWTAKHFEHNGVSAAPDVCAHTVSYCGRDMFRLASEIDKISYYVLASGRERVQIDDVNEAGCPSAEYGVFDFANAILERRADDALAILADMKYRKADPVIIMGEIAFVYYDLLCVKLYLESGKITSDIVSAMRMNEYKAKKYVKCASAISLPLLSRLVDKCVAADSVLKSSSKDYQAIENLISTI